MGNDSGRGSRSDEPPKLATVRRLHLDDGVGSRAAATDEWYETECLTGHITGGARNAPPTDAPAPNEAAVVLDWRHAEATPPPTALKRLGRSLDPRHGRRRGGLARGTQEPSARARRVRRAMPASASEAASAAVAGPDDRPTANQLHAEAPGGPRIDLRGSADQAPQRPKRRAAVDTSARKRSHDARMPRWAIPSAVVLSVGAMCVIAVASEMNSTAAKPHQTRLTAATSRPAATLDTAVKTANGALATLDHRARNSRARHHAIQSRKRPQPAHADHTGAVTSRASAHRNRAPATSDEPRTVDVAASTVSPIHTEPVTQPTYTPDTGSNANLAPTSNSATSQRSPHTNSASASSATDNALPVPGGPPAP